jgi:hypothetical protein
MGWYVGDPANLLSTWKITNDIIYLPGFVRIIERTQLSKVWRIIGPVKIMMMTLFQRVVRINGGHGPFTI